MRFYFAPMEGITGYVHRGAYQKLFPCIDKYFTPFIVPNQSGKLSSKEKNDILPEHNRGIYVVPQILTNKAEDFVRTAEVLKSYGYSEVNLNLGCPSKTVVSKNRGSGFLAQTEELDSFLEQIFKNTDMKISIKTRTGRYSHEEFDELLNIFNQYPLEELIVHPRTQPDFYKSTPNWDVFEEAVLQCKCPLGYNGDIFTVKDYSRWHERFPQVETVMLGRGLLFNPMLVEAIKNDEVLDMKRIRKFHTEIYEGYREVMPGEKVVLFKMKELWVYMSAMFPEHKKAAKKIKKAVSLAAYEAAVAEMFEE